jgi:hypothetical protein
MHEFYAVIILLYRILERISSHMNFFPLTRFCEYFNFKDLRQFGFIH